MSRSTPRAEATGYEQAGHSWNSPRATTTALPPTSTRSICSGVPQAVAHRVDGRLSSAPARSRSPGPTRRARGAAGARRAAQPPSRWPDPQERRPRARTSASSRTGPCRRCSSRRRVPAASFQQSKIGLDTRHVVRRGQHDVDVPDAVVVNLDGELERSTPSAANSSLVCAYGRQEGTGCVIRPKTMRAPSRSSCTGMTPTPVSRRTVSAWSGPSSTNAEPRTGWPAKGSSASGVKIRRRTCVAVRRVDEDRLGERQLAGEVLQVSFRDPASVCEHCELVAGNGRSVKTSQTT